MSDPGAGPAAAPPARGYPAVAALVADRLDAAAVFVISGDQVVAAHVRGNADVPDRRAAAAAAGRQAALTGAIVHARCDTPGLDHLTAVPFAGPDGGCSALSIVDAGTPRRSTLELELAAELAAAAAREATAYARARCLEAVIETQHESIQVVAPDGAVLSMNPAGLRGLGFGRLEDAVGTDFTTFIVPEHRCMWRDAQASVLAGREESLELRLDGPHATPQWVAMHMVPFRDEAGAVVASLSVMACVDDRRIADDAMIRYLSTLRGTLEATADGIIVTDVSGRITAHNRRLCRLIGLAEDVLAGDMLPDVWAHLSRLLVEPQPFAACLARVAVQPHTIFSEQVELRDGRVFEILSQPHGPGSSIAGRVWSIRDLTERVTAERALRSSEARFRSLIENSADIVFASDADARILYISPSVERVLGYAPESLIGRCGFELSHPDDLAGAVQAQRAALEGRNLSETRLRVRASDGSWRWLHFLSQIMPGADDSPILVSSARDITELELAQRELRASNELLHTILAAMPLSVIGLDREGSVQMWNRTAERTFGWTASEALGRPYMLSGPDRRDEHRAAIRDTLAGRPLDGVEVVRYRKDGTPVDVAIWTSAVSRTGDAEPDTMIGLIADVTDRKRVEERLRRNEQRFRALIENALDVVAMLDVDGTIRFGSPSGERLLGYDRRELKGRSILELIHPDDLPTIRRLMAGASTNGSETRMVDVRVRHRDGSWRMLEGLARVLLDEDGRAAGLVVNARDITARRELEAQLRQAQKMEAIGQFAGGVAHDFNNMLTAIKGFAVLLDGSCDERHDHDIYVGEIRRAADRAAALTRQLLAFSRQQILQPQAVDLNAVVSEMSGMLRRLLGADIELRCSLQQGVPPVLADPTQLEQVIMNLAVNARDAMPSGGLLEIATTARTLDDRGESGGPGPGEVTGTAVRDSVVLTVVDDGCGMDESTQARMFDPFFTTKEAGKGTGLGLSTVYGIITQSGGSIEVTSRVGGGTRFDIHLPAASGACTAVAPREDAGRRAPGAGTILLVDDEPGVRFVARRILERSGYRVVEAAGGDEALARADDPGLRIDLLLTDVTMPGMSGPQLAARLAAARADLPIVLMSGYTDVRPRPHDVGGLGFTWLAKPFDPAELRNVVAAALEQQGCSTAAARCTDD